MAPAVSSSIKGASLLVLLQVGSRALTFALNQSLLRFLSPDIMGVSAQLELFSISVLFFARESLRVALQRQTSSLQSIVNIAYIPFVLGVPLTLAFRWLYSNSSSLSSVPFMHQALNIQAFATAVELLAEPAFAVTQQKMLYSIRASAETLATIARCIVTFVAFAYAQHKALDAGALPFALGQLTYATVLVAVYTLQTFPVAASDGTFALTPRPVTDPILTKEHTLAGYLSRPLCTLGAYLYIQSGLKYTLTQGDALIVTAFTSLSEQGAYALASNYGGLIARLLFQPIEESSRNIFAKLCAAPPPPPSSPSSTTATATPSPAPTADLIQAATTLSTILRLYNLLALLAWTLGPRTAPLLLRLVAGHRWAATGADAVLATYTLLIPLLALNGVTEAFVAAVATHAQLRAQALLMAGYSAAFAGAAYLLLEVLGLGARGLVLANCVNMACRIVWNTWFARAFFRERAVPFGVWGVVPSGVSVGAAVGVAGVLYARRGGGGGLVATLAENGALAGVLVGAMAVGERAFLVRCYRLARPAASAREKKEK